LSPEIHWAIPGNRIRPLSHTRHLRAQERFNGTPAMLCSAPGRLLLRAPEDQLQSEEMPELRRYFPGVDGKVQFVPVSRWEEAEPRSPVGRCRDIHECRKMWRRRMRVSPWPATTWAFLAWKAPRKVATGRQTRWPQGGHIAAGPAQDRLAGI
jgi:hypothetical protein